MKIANYEITTFNEFGCANTVIEFQFDQKVGLRQSSKLLYDIFKTLGMWDTVVELETVGVTISKLLESSVDDKSFNSQKMYQTMQQIFNTKVADILLGKNPEPKYLSIFVIKHIENNHTLLDYAISSNKTSIEKTLRTVESKINLYLKNHA